MKKYCIPAAAVWLYSARAWGVSLGEMVESAGTDIQLMSSFLEWAFYLVGLIIAVVGFFRIRKHMEYPQQVSLASSLVTIGVGAAIILTPVVLQGVAEMFDAGTSQAIERQRIQ